MKFTIHNDLLKKYPSTHVGLIFIKNCDNKVESPEIPFVLRESEKNLRNRLDGSELLSLPEIKLWRETYKSFGAKKGRRVSIEAMAKRVAKGDELPSISPLVDLYNAVSLRYVFPCGGEDLDKVEGDVVLGFANGTETFFKIGSAENEPPSLGEVVYKDDAGCLCRCWNWREADRTKLTENTQNAVLVIETLEAERGGDFVSAMTHLKDLVQVITGGQVETAVLSKENPSVEYTYKI